MHVLKIRNVHEALPEAIRLIEERGILKESRNGPVKMLSEPVCTVYTTPKERVMFWPLRDANPFFHFFESLWMLGGRNDVAWISQFNSRIGQYSDNGKTFHGAYGDRWRNWFGFDQLKMIIKALKKNPDDRRQMLQMWDAHQDLPLQEGRKDLPCNTIAHFQVNPETGALDMSVFCRSNDIVWGCYGANAVHFSFLLEYMATSIGTRTGCYRQISDNWHAYVDTLEPLLPLIDECRDPLDSDQYPHSPYEAGTVMPLPILTVNSTPIWDIDLKMFLEVGDLALGYKQPFFRRTAVPMLVCYRAFKSLKGDEKYQTALSLTAGIKSTDWELACRDWLNRRYDNWKKAQDDGVNYGGTS